MSVLAGATQKTELEKGRGFTTTNVKLRVTVPFKMLSRREAATMAPTSEGCAHIHGPPVGPAGLQN